MDLLQSHVVSKIKVCTVPVPEESLADEYLKRFRRNAFNLDDEEDLVVIWNFVRRYDSAINEPEPVKNNREATNAREAANDAFRGRNFDEALKKYNEGLCWAETGTEEMGLLYGNRSALCYEKGEYHHCLLNIALAKQNQYPERLMPKLVTREFNCRERIATEKLSPLPKLPINVKTNPRIPFLANGLMMKGISKYGRAMIAKQVFQPGDVILHERAMISINDPDQWFARCHQCTDIYVFSLIPCPKCISVMYCDEECMTKNWKQVHRFECGFMKRLNRAFSCYVDLGPRIFFYGLSLFGDNVDEMMEYMKTHPRNGSNPFNLDYSKYDPLDEFKNILQVIHNHVLDMTAIPLINFSAVIQCAIYLKNPLVKALFNTKAKQIALISSFVDMMLMLKNITIDNWHMYRASIFPIASICNHSCDPNVFTIVSTLQSEVKMIVIRPIRKGDASLQLSINSQFRTGTAEGIRLSN